MPNPLTSEERTRLLIRLRDIAAYLAAIGHAGFKAVDDATAELARTADDARRLDWLQRMHTLHGSVEFLYCVSEYECRVTKNDGNTWQVVVGDSLRDAIDNMMNAALASSKSEAAEGGEDG